MPRVNDARIRLNDYLSGNLQKPKPKSIENKDEIIQYDEKEKIESLSSNNFIIITEKPSEEINEDSINNLKNELIKEKNNIQKLTNRIKELENQLKEEKEKNKKELIKVEELNKKIQELNNLIKNSSNKDNIINLMNKIISKDEEIKELKSRFPFELLKGEKLMTVIFSSINQDLLYSVICKNTDKFTKIENILYDEFPGYRETQNYFIFNGQKIDKYKNLDENNLFNSAVIQLNQI